MDERNAPRLDKCPTGFALGMPMPMPKTHPPSTPRHEARLRGWKLLLEPQRADIDQTLAALQVPCDMDGRL